MNAELTATLPGDMPKILLVDDLPTNIMVMKHVLDDLDVEIHTASSGNEALTTLLRHRYAVVLLDVQMPEMNGFETAALMQSDVQMQHVPIIFVTAISKDAKYVAQGYSVGAVDYIFKPIEPYILRSKVEVFLDLERQRQSMVRLMAKRQVEAEERLRLESELRQAQKMEAVGQLTSGVAHDFNNFLAAIFANTEVLQADLSDVLSEYQRGLFDAVLLSAEHAGKLVKQLLTYSRRQVSEPKVIDVMAVIEDAKSILAPLLGKDWTLQTIYGEELWPIVADKGEIEQVLVNLVTNARDAMADGGEVVVRVQNVTLDEDNARFKKGVGPHVELSVRDRGSGMSQDVVAHMFEPFYTTKGIGRGTGLGLAIMDGVVGRVGGHVDVESTPGVGTTMRLWIPRAPAGKAPPEVKAASVSKPVSQPIASLPEKQTILFCDDEDMLIRANVKFLSLHGFEVMSATSGAQALALAQARDAPISLLVTDVMMPEMTGTELAERMRELWPGLPVLFISGYSPEWHGVDIDQERALAFLQKPYPLSTMLDKVFTLLKL
jgi:two-component system cell cycle sensor histidine kinase/response regulator CckA